MPNPIVRPPEMRSEVRKLWTAVRRLQTAVLPGQAANAKLAGRVWVQDADPGASARDGDVWIKTSATTGVFARVAGAWTQIAS